jgi:hypothetical protein
LVIDGTEQPRQVIDDNGGACKEPFVQQVPCKAARDGSVIFDTTTLPDGPHTAALVVYDATGVNKVTYGPVDVVVDNQPDPPAAVAAPIGGASLDGGDRATNGTNASVRAKFLPAQRFAKGWVRQRIGRRTIVTGNLVDEVGRPISHAKLVVFAAARVPGAAPKPLAGVETDDKGGYRFAVPAGRNRRVVLAYRPADDAAGFTTTWALRIDVPAPIALTPSRTRLRNGDTLKLTAHVPGGRLPAHAADVAFQVLIGPNWRTFATKPLDPHGTAFVTHRFRVTFSQTRYRFRVVTLGHRAFPFADTHSQPVGVVVN